MFVKQTLSGIGMHIDRDCAPMDRQRIVSLGGLVSVGNDWSFSFLGHAAVCRDAQQQDNNDQSKHRGSQFNPGVGKEQRLAIFTS